MNYILLLKLVSFSLGIFLIIYPAQIDAFEVDSLVEESDPGKIVQAPSLMTEKEMNDLFGEDPYLGQTSYLQSPEGFSQIDKSK